MQTALLGATALALVAAVNLSSARARGAETIRSNLVVRHITALRPRRCARPFGKPLIPGTETPGHKSEGLPGPASNTLYSAFGRLMPGAYELRWQAYAASGETG